METAINIGKSAKLLTDSMTLIKIEAVEGEAISKQLDLFIETFLKVKRGGILNVIKETLHQPTNLRLKVKVI